MPDDIATWLETRRVTIAPIDRDEIVGVGHALDALESILARLREPRPGTVPPRGLLLTGPSGTGKTLCARWLAASLGRIPAYDLPPDVLTPRRVRAAFAHLATRERSCLFLPEIDAVGRSRDWGGHDQPTRRILFALLEAMDGLTPIDAGRGPVVIATSNRSSLDPALVRPGRLGISIVFDLPDDRERALLLERFLRGRRTDGLDLRHLAGLTRGWSPAALRSLVEEADGYALARGGIDEPIRDADALLGIRRASVREREASEDDPVGVAQIWRSAVHEASHSAAALRLGQPVASIRLGTNGLAGQVEAGIERAVRDDRGLRASVVIAMAGIAGERLLLGEPTLGGRDDVRRATQTLLARIEAGIDEDFPPIDRSAFGDYAPKLLDELIVDRILPALERARQEAAGIVLAERDAIERLARILVGSPVLAGDHLARALVEAGLQPSTASREDDHEPARPAARPEPAGATV